MSVHWIRVGQWLLAKTPIHGRRIYYIPTRDEQARILNSSWTPTDFELWGGHPNKVLTDYPGKPPKSEGERAGLAVPMDLAPSTYDPDDEEDPTRAGPPESWVPVIPDWRLPKTRDPYAFSTSELIVRYHETQGRATIVCGYCEAKRKSRDVRRLIKWFRFHPCISPYGVASRD
jgi:hypothetical protein